MHGFFPSSQHTTLNLEQINTDTATTLTIKNFSIINRWANWMNFWWSFWVGIILDDNFTPFFGTTTIIVVNVFCLVNTMNTRRLWHFVVSFYLTAFSALSAQMTEDCWWTGYSLCVRLMDFVRAWKGTNHEKCPFCNGAIIPYGIYHNIVIRNSCADYVLPAAYYLNWMARARVKRFVALPFNKIIAPRKFEYKNDNVTLFPF